MPRTQKKKKKEVGNHQYLKLVLSLSVTSFDPFLLSLKIVSGGAIFLLIGREGMIYSYTSIVNNALNSHIFVHDLVGRTT